ncbi:MAG: DNA alkylation repair protein [Bacteroidota bacterium]
MSTLKEIQAILSKNANAAAAEACRKFVPSAQKVYGIRMPVLNGIARQVKEDHLSLAVQLWSSGAFEERVLAGKLIGRGAHKDPQRALKLIEKFSKDITDWAVCDTLGMQAPKKINKSQAKEIFAISNKLIRSKNPWQRRLALVLSEWYTRDKSFHPAIRKLMDAVKNDEEHYVKMAVKWINRNFEKRK